MEKISLPEKGYETVLTCNQCSDSVCVDVCPAGALTAEDGKVMLNSDRCIGCGLCNLSCPYGGIFSAKSAHKSFKCDGCREYGSAACAENCPLGILEETDAAAVEEQYCEDPCSPGMQFCAGCGMELVLRMVLRSVGPDIVLFGAPSCCVPADRVKVPMYSTLMTNVASAMTGVSRYFHRIGRETICVSVVGDGGTCDIGFGALSAAAERGEKFLFICYDNEAYMNTGIQRSSRTPYGSWTNTTQVGSVGRGKSRDAKDVPMLIAEHGVNYAATATIAYPEDFIRKVKKGAEAAKTGFAYIHVLAPCPTGWKMEPEKSVEVTRAAVETNYFPLWECDKGEYRFTYKPKKVKNVSCFTDYMRRFAHLDEEEIAILQGYVDARYSQIKRLTQPVLPD
nr:4Fe-4S dicluster domain-containing protein [Lachnospiraceae bacterium]